MVRHEDKAKHRNPVDYALMVQEEIKLVVEAKCLGEL